MSVRIALAFGASLCLAACGNADAAASKGHGAASSSASINWSDATLNAGKVDYFFNAMNKMTDYALAHPDFDMDAVAMDGSETEADYARRMNADPKLRGMFTATGIDPAHYANASGTLIGSMFGVGLAGKNLDRSKLPQAAQYYLDHKAEIDGRMNAFKAKGEALAKQHGGDDSE
jgi:ABC-type glycerol-3-phosphate transport system substrate-binding protein